MFQATEALRLRSAKVKVASPDKGPVASCEPDSGQWGWGSKSQGVSWPWYSIGAVFGPTTQWIVSLLSINIFIRHLVVLISGGSMPPGTLNRAQCSLHQQPIGVMQLEHSNAQCEKPLKNGTYNLPALLGIIQLFFVFHYYS